jgi:hypothetical protein
MHPEGDYLAWRSRHYTEFNNVDEGYDTVHIARTSDLTDSIEIDRAAMSSGLAWSPGGQALAIGSGKQITVYSTRSNSSSVVSEPHNPATHPAWLAEDELWFNAGEQDDAQVFRVRFGD